MQPSDVMKIGGCDWRLGACIFLMVLVPCVWAAPPSGAAPQTSAQPSAGVTARDARCPPPVAPASAPGKRTLGHARVKIDKPKTINPPTPAVKDATTQGANRQTDPYGERYTQATALQQKIEDMQRTLNCGDTVNDAFGAQNAWDVIDEAARDEASKNDSDAPPP